jgi:hypothetical protein
MLIIKTAVVNASVTKTKLTGCHLYNPSKVQQVVNLDRDKTILKHCFKTSSEKVHTGKHAREQ